MTVTVGVQRLSRPHRLFSSLGSYCLLQGFGTVADGACSDSCVAGGYSGSQRWLVLVWLLDYVPVPVQGLAWGL